MRGGETDRGTRIVRVAPGRGHAHPGRATRSRKDRGVPWTHAPLLRYRPSRKGALDNFTKGLSKAYADQGILVNTVSPAFIITPLVEEMMREMADEAGTDVEAIIDDFLHEARPHIEVGRPGEIEEVGRRPKTAAPSAPQPGLHEEVGASSGTGSRVRASPGVRSMLPAAPAPST